MEHKKPKHVSPEEEIPIAETIMFRFKWIIDCRVLLKIPYHRMCDMSNCIEDLHWFTLYKHTSQDPLKSLNIKTDASFWSESQAWRGKSCQSQGGIFPSLGTGSFRWTVITSPRWNGWLGYVGDYITGYLWFILLLSSLVWFFESSSLTHIYVWISYSYIITQIKTCIYYICMNLENTGHVAFLFW